MRAVKSLLIRPLRELHDLPGIRQITGQIRHRDFVDQNAEQSFVQSPCETEFCETPARGNPRLANEEKHRLTSLGRFGERFLPSSPAAIPRSGSKSTKTSFRRSSPNQFLGFYTH